MTASVLQYRPRSNSQQHTTTKESCFFSLGHAATDASARGQEIDLSEKQSACLLLVRWPADTGRLYKFVKPKQSCGGDAATPHAPLAAALHCMHELSAHYYWRYFFFLLLSTTCTRQILWLLHYACIESKHQLMLPRPRQKAEARGK